MAQTLRFTFAGSVTPESVAATMSQCSSAVANCRALLRIVPQPVQQLGEAPLVRIDAAAPVDRLQVFGACASAVICRASSMRAMIAPQVVVVERLHRRVDRNHAGAGRVERDGGDVLSVDVVLLQHLTHRAHQRLHLVGVRLRGIVGIVAFACSGYSAEAVPSRPRALSSSVTRTLSVPKSTPATIATFAFLNENRYLIARPEKSFTRAILSVHTLCQWLQCIEYIWL